MSGIAAGSVGAARRTRGDGSVPAGVYADPHTPPRNIDITKEKARGFAIRGRRASLPQVHVRLTGLRRCVLIQTKRINSSAGGRWIQESFYERVSLDQTLDITKK